MADYSFTFMMGASRCAIAIAAVVAARTAHELAHATVARLLGYKTRTLCPLSKCETEPIACQSAVCAVRHAGWMFSVLVAVLASCLHCSFSITAATWWTALDAVASDLLLQRGESNAEFFCGNFGLLLLEAAHSGKVKKLLETMVRVTMMRGAQSAGIVTYTGPSNRGVRKRVVNRKRTDLCAMLMRECAGVLDPRSITTPQIFQGHTRFATSSIAALPGCHPHQWCKPAVQTVWHSDERGEWTAARTRVEAFITHNGDLDFYKLHGVTYALEEVQCLLTALLHTPMPAAVDSACVAGLLDLLRTKGVWRASVRYGYVHGALALVSGSLSETLEGLWSEGELDSVTAIFEAEWAALVASSARQGTADGGDLEEGSVSVGTTAVMVMAQREKMRASMVKRMISRVAVGGDQARTRTPSLRLPSDEAAEALVRAAVDAFFNQDLLAATRQLLSSSVGSFGLVLSTSIDARDEIVVASRGQTMSIAFYPLLGAVLWGSEAAATKAGLGAADGQTRTKMPPPAPLNGAPPTPKASTAPARKYRVSPGLEPTNGHPLPTAANGGIGASDASFKWGTVRQSFKTADSLADGFRFDLDDVNGEVVLLKWGAAPRTVGRAPLVPDDKHPHRAGGLPPTKPMKEMMRYDGGPQHGECCLWAANYQEQRFGSHRPILKRVLRLGGNPLVEPIPAMGGRDPVGRDIADIPSVLQRIHDDWDEPSSSLNRLTAFTLQARLRKRLQAHAAGTHDGSVDLLISGCEVSLWLGEQFASDLHRLFPALKIVVLSANKLLGQLGQSFPTPQVGFSFQEASHNFSDSCVLLISHSGGTFATLSISNLLKGFTPHLFVVTSEWDTQAARAVRSGRPGADGMGQTWTVASYVFTTFTGCRPAEACSLTVAATHQLLTQVLLYLGYAVRYYDGADTPTLKGASTYRTEEIQELEALNQNTLANIRRLIAPAPPGAAQSAADAEAAACRKELLQQAHRWAQHILEGPISWIISAVYIIVSVTIGFTPLSAIAYVVSAALEGDDASGSAAAAAAANASAAAAAANAFPPTPHKYIIGFADAIIYLFLPWWTTVLLRLVQGRPWHHRVAGRSLLIGDVPWVAQSLEAFVSKCFALSYSIAGLHVASANPTDHLVHRHTHRVVRGGLLAVGRPDGRLNALASAEATVCLSVSQASSIQSMGVTLESFTLGHNPYKLGLSQGAAFLPTTRKKFFSEWALGEKLTRGLSVGAMMGLMGQAEAQGRDSRPSDGDAPPRASKPAQFQRIEPLSGGFVGEWMLRDPELRDEPNAALMGRQALVQALHEGRMASLERFVAFVVLFHAMAKEVQDFWGTASCGLLGYDMSRTHSIMRIATTASPVSGSDVRFKMLDLAEETRRLWAARTLQLFYRFLKRERATWELDRLRQSEARAMSMVDGMRDEAKMLREGGAKPGSEFVEVVQDANYAAAVKKVA